MTPVLFLIYDHMPTRDEVGADVLRIVAPGWRFTAEVQELVDGAQVRVLMEPETDPKSFPHHKPMESA